jgi:hypothetical protein
MDWDKHQPFTRNEFCQHVYDVARETISGLRVDPIGGTRYLPYWWLNGEIRVFWDAGISRQTVDLIVNAVQKRAREAPGLTFTFPMLGNDRSSAEQLAQATVRGQIDPDKLFSLALSEHWRDTRRGGRQHADIYITTKPFLNDTASWAAASFKHGTMVFCLHGQRHQNADFLRRVALHETNHLLGMYCHCDDYQNVAGLPYSPKCNMHYTCSHTELCLKCRTHIEYWWQGVQDGAMEAGVLQRA